MRTVRQNDYSRQAASCEELDSWAHTVVERRTGEPTSEGGKRERPFASSHRQWECCTRVAQCARTQCLVGRKRTRAPHARTHLTRPAAPDCTLDDIDDVSGPPSWSAPISRTWWYSDRLSGAGPSFCGTPQSRSSNASIGRTRQQSCRARVDRIPDNSLSVGPFPVFSREMQ